MFLTCYLFFISSPHSLQTTSKHTTHNLNLWFTPIHLGTLDRANHFIRYGHMPYVRYKLLGMLRLGRCCICLLIIIIGKYWYHTFHRSIDFTGYWIKIEYSILCTIILILCVVINVFNIYSIFWIWSKEYILNTLITTHKIKILVQKIEYSILIYDLPQSVLGH